MEISTLIRTDCQPSAATKRVYEKDHRFSFHAHDATQLIFASSGTFSGRVDSQVFSVPPGYGFLVSPRVGHSLICPSGEVEVRDVRFPDEVLPCGTKSRLVKISPLARQIVEFLVQTPPNHWADQLVARTGGILLAHLRSAPGPWLNCPLPQDRRLLRIARHLLDHPDDVMTLCEWAQIVGASTRTLGRLFPMETGLTFLEWRSRAKLIDAVRRLESGNSIQRISMDLGYESTSAFSQMFKRFAGTSPSRYLKLARSGTA